MKYKHVSFNKFFITKLQLEKFEAVILASGLTGLIVYFLSVIPNILLGEYFYLQICLPYFFFIPLILFITYKRKGNILSGLVLSVFLSMLSYLVVSLLWELFKY